MSALQTAIESGRIVDLLLLVIAVEAAGLAIWKRARLALVLLGLMPGLCLMLALRAALADQDWRVILFWITVSLPFHLADLKARLK